MIVFLSRNRVSEIVGVRDEELISNFIKKHRNHIYKCLNKIVQGKEINEVKDNNF